ncbi:hypothetical protein L211DRAFT_833000 [Terfezia boudieri ATCC MYA-4762]|uniref:RED-like N-terminal domain-containing protein n=1 Tax=Terfezia boudieri ATCC MYA-4762 TaxID=1051890 RepID=A0A3N4MA00_9PEZI|nr:hypothetical protein L211DRAFT_833000 [Terfezia boudieri ATCC MYA-4762]
MNNQQFRKLVLDTPAVERADGSSSLGTGKATSGPSTTPSLGSKQRSFIPMTPRSVYTQSDLSRQLAAHNAPPAKKFKSSVPKGMKLGEGYVDRAKARESAEIDAEVAERECRLEALKELARNPETGEVDMALIIQQSKAMGGDAKSTHLVKGLDFALLERVKRGEDVLGLGSGPKGSKGLKSEEPGKDEERLEDELDKALDKVVVPVEKEKVKKPGHKVTREGMLAELKRQKAAAVVSKAAVTSPVPVLDSRFKKIGQPKPKKGSKDGKSLKKKAKGKVDDGINKSSTLLGMLPLPLPPAKVIAEGKNEGDDIDIFDDVGRDYDPLAGLEDDDGNDSGSSADEKTLELEGKQTQEKATATEDTTILSSMPPLPHPKPNYFLESEDDKEERYEPPTSTSALLEQNPDLAAALSKAAKLAERGGPSNAFAEDLEKEKRRKAMLENFDRDAMDMDMGFGGSRDWGDDEEEFVEGSKGGKKRKRGPKGPKKSDKDNAELMSKFASEKYGKG